MVISVMCVLPQEKYKANESNQQMMGQRWRGGASHQHLGGAPITGRVSTPGQGQTEQLSGAGGRVSPPCLQRGRQRHTWVSRSLMQGLGPVGGLGGSGDGCFPRGPDVTIGMLCTFGV